MISFIHEIFKKLIEIENTLVVARDGDVGWGNG